ncbi:MmgE/PrpD family protein [Pseudorhodoplanes sp.]|uniref:MmgE/PrpD family protein n=1 Tax=Pseudorhodoplanes sp. TaxID=1934341 RepID=UPI003D097415
MNSTATPVISSIADLVIAPLQGTYPREVTDAARMCFVDWCGVALGAVEELPGMIAARAMQDEGRSPVLSGGKMSALISALVNGTLAHTLDFDDTHVPSLTHISGATWATIVALSATPGREDADILDAFIKGFEVGGRLGRNIGPAMLERGLHATATIASLAATAAGCALLQLDRNQIMNAMGLAATQAGGLTISFGTMAKPFHAGKAAMNAVIAVQMARHGFEASLEAFDSPEGLARAVVQDRALAFRPVDDSSWQILLNTFKPYASCLLTHPLVDCARSLAQTIGPMPAQKISARVHPLAIRLAGKTRPSTPLEGKFSLSYCIALAFAGYPVSAANFTAQFLRDETLARLANRVTLEPDERLRETAARMNVTLEDGSEQIAEIAFARGNPENPMQWSDLEAKFVGLTENRLGVAQAKALFDELRKMQRAADVSVLAAAA